MNVSRRLFVNAVYAGLQESPGLPQEQRNALLSVAHTMKQVAVGVFHLDECECPVTAAGIVRRDQFVGPDEPVWAFVLGFDRAMRASGVVMGKVTIEA